MFSKDRNTGNVRLTRGTPIKADLGAFCIELQSEDMNRPSKYINTLSWVGVGLLGTTAVFAGTSAGEFEDVSMSVVYSATDDDAQIIVQGGADDAFVKVRVTGPGGAVKLRVRVKDGADLGYADFQFDSPEPSLEELEHAYPAGEYLFAARTAAGSRLRGQVEWSYELLDAPVITFPMEGDEGIPTAGLTVLWEEIEDADAIRFEIEDEEEEVALTADLPGEATSFMVSDGWLRPETVYTLDIKAIAENGNQTVSDLRFLTAE